MIRCFEDENVIHVAGKVDPQADMDVINLELALSDLTQASAHAVRIRCSNSPFEFAVRIRRSIGGTPIEAHAPLSLPAVAELGSVAG